MVALIYAGDWENSPTVIVIPRPPRNLVFGCLINKKRLYRKAAKGNTAIPVRAIFPGENTSVRKPSFHHCVEMDRFLQQE